MDVIFKVSNSKYRIEIGFFDTVLEMKETLERKHGFPISRRTFVYNGKVLKHELDTEYCEIYEGCHIQVFLEPERRKLQVMVKRPNCQYPLENDVLHTVGFLKEKIQNIEKVPTNRLLVMHSGIEMEDHRCLGEYGVSDQWEINVAINLLALMMEISDNRSMRGMKIPVDVSASTTVHDLKMKLKDKGIAPNEHFFVYNHDVMSDNRSLRWHKVQDGDTLCIFNGSVRGGM